jgi:hypothetical protein
MSFVRKAAIASLLSIGVAACTTGEKPETASASKPAVQVPSPYPSTYKAYPGVATAIRNVTIYDGEGGRIDNGVVFMSGGKVSSVGGPDTPIPADVTIIDGAGKYVTPGIIARGVGRA